jgi:hypothetical protein
VSEGRRIALGTAQLGQPYGVTNRLGPPGGDEVAAIIRCARENGADTLDTAMSYGDSELVLGAAGVQGFRVITKLPPLVEGVSDVETWVRASVRRSLKRMRIGALHGLLLHQPADALGPLSGALLATLASLKAEKLVENVGVSVYAPGELAVLEGTMALDIVQVPYNVLDRRFEQSGLIDRLAGLGARVHVRSVLLQGLLATEENAMPAQFAPWSALWTRWFNWVREQGLSPIEAALGFVLRNRNVERVVVGVESAAQLEQIMRHARVLAQNVPAGLATDDLTLINPTNWKAL